MNPPAPPSHDPPRPTPRSRFLGRVTLLLVALAILVFAGFAIHWGVQRLSHSVTDDAFVETHIVNIAPEQVSGRIVRYLVQEDDHVRGGELLVEIDPVPYRDQVEVLKAKLLVAQDQLAAEEVSLERLRAEVPRQIDIAARALAAAKAEQGRDDDALKYTTEDVDKAIKEARAFLEASQAAYVLAEQEYKRFTTLYDKDAVSQRRAQEATKAYQATKADVKLAEAKLARAVVAEKKVDVARQTALAAAHQTDKSISAHQLAETRKIQIKEAESIVKVRGSQVEETRRALAVAETNLKYTRIVAPFDGVIVKLYRHLGDYVQAGTPVLSLYNPALTYVTANLEETKLEGVAPGNAVRLDIDAFSAPFRGRVVWINKATGANFALIPRNAAAGEFTKVVQRVPVRILIEKDERWPLLRAGLSLTVYIAHGPGDPEWARQAARTMREIESTVVPTPGGRAP
jgi:membrane fusion protein, multidrug efflux system